MGDHHRPSYTVARLRHKGIEGPVLDFGCGRGGLVDELRRAGFDAYGADVFFDGMDYSEIRSSALFETGHVKEIVDGRLPFGDDTFEAIVSDQVIEHVEDLTGFVAELDRVLAPGGHMYHQYPTLEIVREAHFALPWIHRLSGRTRWWTMFVLRKAGFGKHTAEDADARAWATSKSRWLDDFCVYRRAAHVEDLFRDAGFAVQHEEVDYCRHRARGRGIVGRLVGVRALEPLVRLSFRRLAFDAIALEKPRRPRPLNW